MSKISVLTAIKQLRRHVFTTHEISAYCNGSSSNTVQALNNLCKKGVVLKIYRGLWGFDIGRRVISPHQLIPFLLPNHQAYLSFISALHLYGIVEQIPQSITVASTSHTRVIKTKLGSFFIHRIAPSFFKGFHWYKGSGDFLIAEPEKAFVDCLYVSVRRKKQFGYFPELHFPKTFSFRKVKTWVQSISDPRVRAAVLRKLDRTRGVGDSS